MDKQFDRRFIYHEVEEGSDTEKNYQYIREAAKSFSLLIYEVVPDSREKSLALTKIEEAMMWANASIARN